MRSAALSLAILLALPGLLLALVALALMVPGFALWWKATG